MITKAWNENGSEVLLLKKSWARLSATASWCAPGMDSISSPVLPGCWAPPLLPPLGPGGTSGALVLSEVGPPHHMPAAGSVSAWGIRPLMAFVAAARQGHCCPLWVLGLVVLLTPSAYGECGALPTLSHAAPSDTDGTDSFPINTVVAYKCQDGFLKIPGKSNTVVCLSNSQWSNIEEFCGRSCPAPPRLKSAELNDMDLRKSYYPVGSNVSYVCRLAYESTALIPVITCLENLRWSEAPEFCLRKSCGVPKSPEHGRPANTTDNLFGAKVYILCDEGYKISGRTFIQCLLHRDQVEWTQLPTCQLITCSPPPPIINGMHNGSSVKSFDYNSTVTYRCDHNFSLTGEASIHCTTKDKINGVWNGSAPECKVVITQDKPTTVPSGGTEIGGTFSGLGRHIDIAIGTSIGTVVLVAVTALITLTVWKKKGVKTNPG